jgi:hypothetical protein
MPPTQVVYPNLESPFITFLIETNSTSSSDNNTTSTALPPSVLQTLSTPAPKTSSYDFSLERKILEDEVVLDKAKASDRVAAAKGARERGRLNQSTSSVNAGAKRGRGDAEDKHEATVREETKADIEMSNGSEAKDDGSPSNGNSGNQSQQAETSTTGTTQRRALLQRMASLTMASEDKCDRYLSNAKWNLETAVQDFYSSEG